MNDKKKLDDLKGAAKETEAPFSVEEGLKEEELEEVSGGALGQCLCKCAADSYPYNPTCGGGGGGGSSSLEGSAQ